ncbi:hypothetical protein PABG_11082 [Paracoccidioides brasiliensis Pb03]|nr:hypothetical protein PABG_11082 [Paracoccidioides brasiliensis Pb03]
MVGTDAAGYPEFMVPTMENSSLLSLQLKRITLSPSTAAPWKTWDISRPASYTWEQLVRLKERARTDDSGRPDISRLDVLLAHVWAAIQPSAGPWGINRRRVYKSVYRSLDACISATSGVIYWFSIVPNPHAKRLARRPAWLQIWE